MRIIALLRTSATRVLNFIDQRFASGVDEAAYLARIEHKLSRSMLSMMAIILTLFPINSWTQYASFVAHADVPFSWSSTDPRTVMLSVRIGFMCASIGMSLLALGRLRFGFFKKLSFEIIYATFIVFGQASFYFMGGQCIWLFDPKHRSLFEKDELIYTEMYNAFVLMTVGLFVCAFVPIRGIVIWVVPLSGSIAYCMTLICGGSSYADGGRQVLMLLSFVLCICFHLSRTQEQISREKWLVEQQVEETEHALLGETCVTKALCSIASTLLEVVVKLDEDLCIIGSGHCSIFGESLHGRHFPDILMEADRSRFDAARRQALENGELQSIPIVIPLLVATLEVQLVMVHTGINVPCFIIGLHSVQRKFENAIDVNFPLALGDLEAVGLADAQDDRGSMFESLATTTATGRIFEELQLARKTSDSIEDEVRTHLSRIADLGFREHWLIATSDVLLNPDIVFGKGSFGIVIAASFHGTPVVAKLPNAAGKYDADHCLINALNELRVCRQIRHPNLVAFHGACVDPDSGSLVLLYEIVRGMRLDLFIQRLCSQAQSEPSSQMKLMIDVSTGLRYLHCRTQPVVHGDLKPSNIMVERFVDSPRAKLLDFGLSRVLTKEAKPLGGTRSWVAPELVSSSRANRKPTLSADVFSYGLVMRFVTLGFHLGSKLRRHAIQWPDWALCEEVEEDEFTSVSQVCENCLALESLSRPKMSEVQEALLDSSALLFPQAMSGEVVALACMPCYSWKSGMRRVQQNAKMQSVALIETQSAELIAL